jgi:uncharacterized lipoprotein YddW (UPF0748 family)
MQVRETMGRVCLAVAAVVLCAGAVAAPAIPATPRDYRCAWCATVTNIDWPASAGTSAATVTAQKALLVSHLDAMVSANMNCMYLQVRPACDAMYASNYEPWSQWLTGSQSTNATWDPLTYAVTEAHNRGIELHAWVNPYRAALDQTTSTKGAKHVMKVRPDLCIAYKDGRTYLDPGKADTITSITDVIGDIVTRYDVDGVVFDDYFYPGRDFQDSTTYGAYAAGGGSLSWDDWRRDNVNKLIQSCYTRIHSIRNTCQFEVGPFGIWQPGYPSTVTGSNYYTDHYCDTRKWLQQGWVDSLSPQLYWVLASPGQPFGDLIDWWAAQNPNRHVLASTADYRVANATYANWGGTTASEIVNQVNRVVTAGGVGTVHYSIKWLTNDPEGVRAALTAGPYAKPALKPASTWLDSTPPPAPNASISLPAGLPLKRTITFSQNVGDEAARWWCVNTYDGTTWTLAVLPGSTTSYQVDAATLEYAVSAVDRAGNESAKTQMTVPVTLSKIEVSAEVDKKSHDANLVAAVK